MKRFRVVLIALALSGAAAIAGETLTLTVIPTGSDPTRWYKGNTHAHTLNSDGDSSPDEVARWYQERGYQFLVLTDHNFITRVDGLNAVHGADEQFLVISGEEVTSRLENRAVHVNGLNGNEVVGEQIGSTVAEIIQRSVDGIRSVGGVPHINHPNFLFSITAEDMRRVNNYNLFEVFNGAPVNNFGQGGGGAPGPEEMWDTILSSGRLLYGIAVDDAHVFRQPWAPNTPQPGTGWVHVRATGLEAETILEALDRGDFYASTGVELNDYRVTGNRIEVDVNQSGGVKYRVDFIGGDGRLLKQDLSNPASYEIEGNETYVRAKVVDTNGNFAWTQPVMLE